jgi:DNA-binding NarL/FixJ family response regulator
MIRHSSSARSVERRVSSYSTPTARRKITPLTSRQKTILLLVLRGLSNRDIAHQLQLSVRTVDTHRYHTMRRLGVHKVSQLLRIALKQHLLTLKDLTHPTEHRRQRVSRST